MMCRPWLSALVAIVAATRIAAQQPFTLEQVKSYPFPNELTASAQGSKLAWAMNERGLRNLYGAEGPSFAARQLTHYRVDDGQELTSVSVSADGRNVVFVRGGDHGGNWTDFSPNPLSLPTAQKIQVLTVPFAGGEPKVISDGDEPAISPSGANVAFVKGRQIWIAPVDGSTPARQMFSAKGDLSEPVWSPDGSRLAFISSRGDHAFIGVFVNDSTPLQWIAPSTSHDDSPRWSPDSRRIAFVRRPGTGGVPDSALVARHQPWSINTADVATGDAHLLWKSPETLRGSTPTTQGGTNLHWAALGRIVFLSYKDGWPHLYSIPETGGEPLLLTPGNYMAEYITVSPDGKMLAFAGNAGSDVNDIDRRHVVVVPVDRAEPRVFTPGTGLEWTPVFTGDNTTIAYLGATAQRPPMPMVQPVSGGAAQMLATDRLPNDFPAADLVTPRKVVFKSPDGMEVHAQVFSRAGAAGRRPAIVYLHGGPPRQMLLGWHYSDYYTNAYAMNQYLASQGYIVMSVNYRLGIGYGREFQHPARGGAQGASEYIDVKAAGEWLRTQPDVDPSRIGIYGGSYGGFLTALALGRNSDLFAAGVDIHGVHNWTAERARGLLALDRFEKIPDAQRALEIAWKSSPVSSVSTWRSPVLLIHGDDDRNVQFSQTVDLVRRLATTKVQFEQIIIPDDTHHFMRHANQVRVDAAVAEYFGRKLLSKGGRAAGKE